MYFPTPRIKETKRFVYNDLFFPIILCISEYHSNKGKGDQTENLRKTEIYANLSYLIKNSTHEFLFGTSSEMRPSELQDASKRSTRSTSWFWKGESGKG